MSSSSFLPPKLTEDATYFNDISTSVFPSFQNQKQFFNPFRVCAFSAKKSQLCARTVCDCAWVIMRLSWTLPRREGKENYVISEDDILATFLLGSFFSIGFCGTEFDFCKNRLARGEVLPQQQRMIGFKLGSSLYVCSEF